MFQSDYFVLHLAHFHAPNCAAWLVKQINERAWQAADQNDEEAKRSDENGLCFRNSTKTAEHDLQNLFTKSYSRETDGQCGDCAFHRHHSKKVDHWHGRAQRVSRTKKRSERGKVRDERCTKRDKRRAPMMRVEMIGCGNLNEFVATRELLGQRMEQVKSADYKSGHQRQDRCAEEKEQDPEQISRLGSLREKIITKPDESDGNRDQSYKADETIKHHSE